MTHALNMRNKLSLTTMTTSQHLMRSGVFKAFLKKKTKTMTVWTIRLLREDTGYINNLSHKDAIEKDNAGC